jgi:MFS superfamily sulfate permease-like transporter
MNDAHQTPLEEAISFLTIAAILVAVACYAAAVQNLPVASPALLWVASILYHWFPVLNAVRTPQMPMLVSAAAVGGTFFVVGIPFAGLLATWFSSAQIANLERQTAKLQRNRARVQKQRRDRDRYDAR